MDIPVYLSEHKIQTRIKELATKIMQDNPQGEIVIVTVLQGAHPFSLTLQKYFVNQQYVIHNYPIQLKSYEGKKGSDTVTVAKDINSNVKGKKVLIVEDIIDRGNTITFLKKYLLEEKGVEEVKIASLLDKKSKRLPENDGIVIDYLGFDIPDVWVVGFGLDYNEQYRDLPFIGTLDN